MYIKPAHQPQDFAQAIRLIHENRFGICVTSKDGRIVASHLPFLFDPDKGSHGILTAHLATANEQIAHFADSESEVLVIFSGAHDYISPSEYPHKATAPTWNYAAVHCYGRPRLADVYAETVRAAGRIAHEMERDSETPWTIRELGADGLEKRKDRFIGLR